MNVLATGLSVFLVWNGALVYAAAPTATPTAAESSKFGDVSPAPQSKGMFNKLSLGALYSYTDFDFDSTAGGNFNRFQGHSNLYSVGVGNVQLYPDVTAGIALFRVDTALSSQVYLDPGVPAT